VIWSRSRPPARSRPLTVTPQIPNGLPAGARTSGEPLRRQRCRQSGADSPWGDSRRRRAGYLSSIGDQEGVGCHRVACPVGVFVGSTRGRRALPGPLADRRDIARKSAEPRQGHPLAEVSGVEGAEHIGDADAERLVDLRQQGVVVGGPAIEGMYGLVTAGLDTGGHPDLRARMLGVALRISAVQERPTAGRTYDPGVAKAMSVATRQ
jgi:hypothetical protein